MSLSNGSNGSFEPINIQTLDTFDQEISRKTDTSAPDFDRFKLLIEEPVFDEEVSDEFEALFKEPEEKEDVFFTPLIEPPEEKEKRDEKAGDPESGQAGSTEEPEVVTQTEEEKGYKKGFEKGLNKGMAQGEKKGYKEGFEKGELEGFEKGEPAGFEKGEQEGFEKGLQEGSEKAQATTREEASGTLNLLEESLELATRTLDLLVEKYEPRIISLIQQIAKKAIMARIEIDDEIVKHMILDALKTLVQPEEVTLSVSMDDYEYIEMVKSEFFEKIESLTSVSVQSDPSLNKGACRIDTICASIQSDPESRMEAIFEAMKTTGGI